MSDDRTFPDLTAAELALVRTLGEPRDFADGQPVFRPGDANLDLFVVESGAVEIRNPADADAVVATHGPGQFAGDIDLLTGRPVSRSMSPANWPGPWVATTASASAGLRISTAPDSTTKRSRLASPGRKTGWPSAKSRGSPSVRTRASSAAVRSGKVRSSLMARLGGAALL